MADRIRGFPWENTSLGSIGSWPTELVMAVNMVLSSNVIATLFWGSEQIMVYNDLYRPHLGAKHPALGQTLRTAWAEVYDLVEPVFVRPFQTGIATIAEQVSMQVLVNGQLVERIYTMDVNPIRGESPQGSVILGLSQAAIDHAEEFHRTNLLNFFLPEDRDYILSEFLPLVQREGHGYMETRFMHQKTGEAIPMSYQLFLLEDEKGQPFGFGTVSRDLTVEKQTAAALLQNEKLAAVGRLAASIAHEINNPLESVTNLLYLARTSQDFGDVQGYLDTAERELRRVSIISNQTLRFYEQSSKPTIISCGNPFGEVLSIYQGRLVNSHISVEKRKRATRSAECFEGEIRQVLNNFIGNAIDAMHPTGSRLLVRSR